MCYTYYGTDRHRHTLGSVPVVVPSALPGLLSQEQPLLSAAEVLAGGCWFHMFEAGWLSWLGARCRVCYSNECALSIGQRNMLEVMYNATDDIDVSTPPLWQDSLSQAAVG